jgi:hypothetical protein
MFDVLFAHRDDAYPSLPEYQRKMSYLTRPEVFLFRFLWILQSVRQYMDKVNAGSREDFDEIFSRLQAELVTGDLPLHRKWRAMQDDVMRILKKAAGRKETFFFTKATMDTLHAVTSAGGIRAWVDSNYTRFMARGKRLVKASDRAVRAERLRVHRTELRKGTVAVVDSSLRAEWNTLKVTWVRGDHMKLSGGHKAEFKRQTHGGSDIPFGEWQITAGKLKGRNIRKLLPLDREIHAARMGLLTADGKVEMSMPSMVLDGSFQAVVPEEFTYSSRVRSGSIRISDIARDVLPKGTYATLPVYMIRRFGYPECGSDDHKDIMGGWRITTPEPGLVLSVTPCGSGIPYSIGYGFSSAAARELETAHDAWWVHQRTRTMDVEPLRPHLAVIARYSRAVRVAIADLARPTGVRDSNITAEGKVNDKDLNVTPEGEVVSGVAHSKTCNYGVDSSLFVNFDSTCDLLEAAAHFGPSVGEAYAMAAKVLKKKMR